MKREVSHVVANITQMKIERRRKPSTQLWGHNITRMVIISFISLWPIKWKLKKRLEREFSNNMKDISISQRYEWEQRSNNHILNMGTVTAHSAMFKIGGKIFSAYTRYELVGWWSFRQLHQILYHTIVPQRPEHSSITTLLPDKCWLCVCVASVLRSHANIIDNIFQKLHLLNKEKTATSFINQC